MTRAIYFRHFNEFQNSPLQLGLVVTVFCWESNIRGMCRLFTYSRIIIMFSPWRKNTASRERWDHIYVNINASANSFIRAKKTQPSACGVRWYLRHEVEKRQTWLPLSDIFSSEWEFTFVLKIKLIVDFENYTGTWLLLIIKTNG